MLETHSRINGGEEATDGFRISSFPMNSNNTTNPTSRAAHNGKVRCSGPPTRSVREEERQALALTPLISNACPMTSQ